MTCAWNDHGRDSNVVDPSGFLVGLLKDKKLSSPRKCSYKVNLNFIVGTVDISYHC